MNETPLEIAVRHVSGVAVCDFAGSMVIGPGAEQLRETLLGLFEKGDRRIVANLEAITYADSASLGELVSAYASLARRGGAMKLLRPSERVSHLLKITRLDTVFEIFADEKTAISSFRASSAAHNAQALDQFLE